MPWLKAFLLCNLVHGLLRTPSKRAVYSVSFQIPASRSCFSLRPLHSHVLCTSRGPPLGHFPFLFISSVLARAYCASASLASLQSPGPLCSFLSLESWPTLFCLTGCPVVDSSNDKSCLSSQDIPPRPSLIKLIKWMSLFLLHFT